MTFETFCEKARTSMAEYMGEECEVVIEQIIKNNGLKLSGLIVHKELNEAVPTIYLESYFENYQNGQPLGEVMSDIIHFYETYAGVAMDISFFNDYSVMKDKIVCKLIHYEKNLELLSQIPYVAWEDLAIVFYYLFAHEQMGNATVLIRNEQLKHWNVTAQDLYKTAMNNVERILDEELIPIHQVIESLLPEDLLPDSESLKDVPMYVLTNKWKQYGATSMLYSKKLKLLSEEKKCNLYIMPSSIHEVIVVPEYECRDVNFMQDLVEEVNRTQVADEEILSDRIYYYDRSTRQVALIS